MAKSKQEETDFETEMNDLSKKGELGLPTNGIDIHGMEEVPATIIPIPYVRLVQPTSQKVEMANGDEAPVGTFYFNDSQRTEEELMIAIIKGKHGKVQYDPEKPPIQKLAILAKDMLSDKMFILSLSVMSFSPFGQLIAQLKEKHVKNMWEYAIRVTSEKQENDKGKYYIAKFKVEEKITDDDQAKLNDIYEKYGEVLDARKEEEQ